MADSKPKLIFKTKPLSEYQGVVNSSADTSKGLYIIAQFQFEDTSIPIRILLDTGCTMSLLSNAIFQQIPDHLKQQIQQTNRQIKFADGGVQKSAGIVSMPLWMGEKCVNIDFLMGSNVDKTILGLNDIRDLDLTVNFRQMLVTIGDDYLPVHDVQSNLIGRKVFVRKSTVIPLKPQAILPTHVEDLENKLVIAENPVMHCNKLTLYMQCHGPELSKSENTEKIQKNFI